MACYKRILHELNKKIPEKMITLDLDNKFTFVALGNDIVSKEIGVINKKTHKQELQLIIPSDYPFKPPSVFVVGETPKPPKLRSFSTIIPFAAGGLGVSPKIKYDKWGGSIIHKADCYRPVRGEPDCDLFSAWAFSVIRRPRLMDYWRNIPNKNSCLCCVSITCGGNWSPSITMCDILAEYVVRRDFKINCGRLMQRWIGAIFNNDRWVIPDDLILLIVKGMLAL